MVIYSISLLISKIINIYKNIKKITSANLAIRNYPYIEQICIYNGYIEVPVHQYPIS
jgi:hypothetical protein